MKVRRVFVTLLAIATGASVLALAPVGLPSAVGQGEPTLTVDTTEGPTGTAIGVRGTGCFLPDGVTGADGLLFQLIAADGSAAASETLLVERDGTVDTTFSVPAGVPAATYSVRGTCIAPMYEDLGVLAAGTFTVTGEGAGATTSRAPATPRFPEQIEPYPAYDGQSSCSPAAKPGMVAFRDMVQATYAGTGSYGISRDCGIGGTSEHKEGRAWDWAVDANSAADRRKVANLIRWLFATDQYGHRHAMARRLGVMYIIWNRRIFRMYRPSEGWTSYSGSSPHTDHVHFSLTRPGGNKRTSFWTLGFDGPDEPSDPPTPNPPPGTGPRAAFSPAERSVAGDYDFSERGDFDGDGNLDILWYGRGSKPEVVWWGRSGRGFTVRGIDRSGSFRPIVGDFNGDGRSDILWYRPGPASDDMWWGRRDRTFDDGTVSVRGRFARSMAGDFDGDGRDDIFWYGPGGRADKVWYGRADRRFVGRATTVSGTYRAVAGDFDGNGRHDVLWYAPGAGEDFVWFGKGDRTFESAARRITFDRRPIVGDFNGNGTDDVFWYGPGSIEEKLWWGLRRRVFVNGTVDAIDGNYTLRTAGDFDEDRTDDVLWYRRNGTSSIWWTR